MAYNTKVEDFRDEEYPMMQEKVYLDHAGTTVYARSVVETFSQSLMENLYGNPHSGSAPAKLSGDLIDRVRAQTLAFFRADPEHFDLVFTANATASIKLVAESFRDLAEDSTASGAFWYGYHKDSHTSLVGIRELTRGSHHCFGSDLEVEEWLQGTRGNDPKAARGAGLPGLFAYPGQSNMTGRRLPLSWSEKLRRSNVLSHQNTYSLLDAAALATTSQLDLSNPYTAPDFTAVSFYKIFGFPDLGGLIVRRASGHILLWRKYFGGGTINSLTLGNGKLIRLSEPTVQRKDSSIHDSLEDGTLPFHNIMALGCAIDAHRELYGSMTAISMHTSFLTQRLYLGLRNLRHFNGSRVCNIYADEESSFGNPLEHGGTIAFNIRSSGGDFVGHSAVEQLANDRGIYLRSGGLCNSGGITSYLELEPWQMKRNWSAGHRCGEPGLDILNGKPTGVVRASLGAMSTMADVDTLITFLAKEYVELRRSRDSADTEIMTLGDALQLHRVDSGYISAKSSVDGPRRSASSRRFKSLDLREKLVTNFDRRAVSYDYRPAAASHSRFSSSIHGLASTPEEFRMNVWTEAAPGKFVPKGIPQKKKRSFRFWRTDSSRVTSSQ